MPLFLVDPRSFVPTVAPELHAPDGFLSVPVALAMWAIAIVAIAVSVSRANRTLDERAVPLMGVTAAFVFAAQMVNFPVIGGTSGHLVGAVLAAILLGPWAATLVMVSVISVQALVFGDGGILALGANIVHMGVIGTIGGYAVYRLLTRVLGGEERARYPAAAIAAWTAVVAGSAIVAVELALSGTSPLFVALPAMLGVHALIGVGEAAITVGALVLIASVRPDLLRLREGASAPSAAPAGATG